MCYVKQGYDVGVVIELPHIVNLSKVLIIEFFLEHLDSHILAGHQVDTLVDGGVLSRAKFLKTSVPSDVGDV